MAHNLRFIIGCLLIPLLFSACASNKNQYDGYTEEELYQIARQYMVDASFTKAIDAYQALETRFPFGQHAEQSQLEVISAYYQAQNYAEAISSAERFTRLNPDHPNVDSAYYYKGLSNFDENRSLFDRFFELDMSQRDLGTARDAFQDFAELVSKTPDSRFAADARARMLYLRNIMARGEIHIADHYFKRGAYTAAANRGRFVIEHYQQTPAAADALAIMVQAYRLLGMTELENDSFTTLKQNHPKHYSINEDGTFKDSYQLKTSEAVHEKRGVAGYSKRKSF